MERWRIGDKDGDGLITWGEFQRLLGRCRARKVYQNVDADNSGCVAYVELQDALERDAELEELIGIKQVIKLMTDWYDKDESCRADTNKDGKVSFDEFWEFIQVME